ncbi:MAG: tRNA pseudouridine(55) synthase TruB [Candidatus Gastranaerophilales bacterium]|nr:tRNA pseudouridine(55) synthase TruB [Candidatus Gastranaerophilales bacterium]
MFGFLNVEKPKGVTSHDVVALLRRVTHIKQIGHAGTLDPMATGVLPLALGKATRLFEYFSDEKAYCVVMQLGKISDTYDAEGRIETFSEKKITEDELISVLPIFMGEIVQVPPAHSAVHYKGQRLYELARKGIIPDDIPKRVVNVSKINLIEFDNGNQTAKLEIECAKGTYIRSIVNDIGMALDCGAYMIELQRTQSSNFYIKNSINLEQFTDIEVVKKHLINPLEVLSYNRKSLTEEEFNRIKNGNSIRTTDIESNVLLLTYDDKLVAMANVEDNLIKVNKVLL